MNATIGTRHEPGAPASRRPVGLPMRRLHAALVGAGGLSWLLFWYLFLWQRLAAGLFSWLVLAAGFAVLWGLWRGLRTFHGYAIFHAFWVWYLVFAGGLVTSNDAALSVPDWPLAFGKVFPPMPGGILFEHTHRMIAALAGLMTVGIALWSRAPGHPRWRRTLVWGAVGAVIAQGLLGGLTVKWLTPRVISASHALLGQTYLCLIASLAITSSRAWEEASGSPGARNTRAVIMALRLALAAVFIQLVLGAWMRHSDAGLALTTWPLSEPDHFLPSAWNEKVTFHFLHRWWGVVVAWLTIRAGLKARAAWEPLRPWAWLLVLLPPVQVLAGAVVIWSGREPYLTTAHVAIGAAILACIVVSLVWAHRGSACPAPGAP